MKTFVVVLAMMMVVLSYGAAYAIDDQMPSEFGISNIGPVAHDTTDWSAKGTVSFAAGEQVLPIAPSRDLGVALALAEDASISHGAAAGGLGASAAARTAATVADNWYNLAY